MGSIGEQITLAIASPPKKVDMPLELIWAKRSQGAAFTLACDASGLEDKELCAALNIDAGTFSRIKKGDNTLSNDRIKEFCTVVGNTIYPQWIAYQVGCGIVMLKTEAERIAEALRAELETERKTTALLKDILAGRAA